MFGNGIKRSKLGAFTVELYRTFMENDNPCTQALQETEEGGMYFPIRSTRPAAL